MGPPLSAHGKGQGIICKCSLSWGISCVERCAHAMGMLVHVPINPSGKKPPSPPPAPPQWPCRCSSGEPSSSVLAQPVPQERAGKEQLWLTTYPGMRPSCVLSPHCLQLPFCPEQLFRSLLRVPLPAKDGPSDSPGPGWRGFMVKVPSPSSSARPTCLAHSKGCPCFDGHF